MKNFNSLTQLLLAILLSNLFADYSVENAFPNLTFEDPIYYQNKSIDWDPPDITETLNEF